MLQRASVLFLMAALAACATVPIEETSQKSNTYFKMGAAHLGEGKIQQAFIEFQKALELTPNDKEVLNAIGVIYLVHFDELPKAIDFFERAVRIDPGYSDAYNNLGYANEKLGRYDTAIANYQKAVSNLMYTTPEKAYIGMGNSYYRLRKHDQALSAYREAIKRNPNIPISYYRIALCHNALGRYGDASTAMMQGIAIDPEFKGDKAKAMEVLNARRVTASGLDLQDIKDYLEILKY
ncbi:MAG: hypothetical protein OHK006_18180 [Thermodesulfovibrionales bacterium]